VTLQDLVNNISGGDLNKFSQTIQLQYYNTPDKIKPFLSWTAYDFSHLLAYNTWTGPDNRTVTITNLNQFWDLYKFGYGTHILDSPHVYIAKVYTFYLMTKKVKVGVLDPVTGIGSFFAIRSVQPATTGGTTTHTNTNTGTSTHTSTSTHTNTNTGGTTSSAQQSSTSSSSSSGKGICGPAFIVALAALPLLLRRRR